MTKPKLLNPAYICCFTASVEWCCSANLTRKYLRSFSPVGDPFHRLIAPGGKIEPYKRLPATDEVSSKFRRAAKSADLGL